MTPVARGRARPARHACRRRPRLPPLAQSAEALPLPPPTTRQGGKLALPAAPGLEERIPLRGMRKRIFEGMTRSKHTAAHFTFVEECDVGALKALRARLRPAAEKAGVKLTFLPFFVKAVVAALKRHPTLNSAFDEATQEIVVRRFYDIGIASATEAGLIVPVVRSADRKSILDIARDIQRLGEETKVGKVRPEDLGGSTFTITSLGQQGGLFATPILNFPEVGILGIHQMKQKPVVRDGRDRRRRRDAPLALVRPPHHRRPHRRGLRLRDHRLPRRPGPALPRDGLRWNPQILEEGTATS